ncbi:MAG TPA: lipid-A-disaccharide synthase N-terminal domain-containing protein, partial [Waddliaceae bacterium]
MIENWRILLYYPLGLLPALFFTLRLLIQWFQSEKEKRSLVTPVFWKLSLTG